MTEKVLLLFIEGLLSFISPCILPLLPLYFVYLAGEASCDAYKRKNRLYINAFGFILGFTVIFVALGATATTLGSFLGAHIIEFKKISGILVILFGINFLGIFKIPLLNREKKFTFKKEQLKFTGSVLFGIVFGFAWTPCVGAFLGTALFLASDSNTVLEGAFMLFIYAAGLGIPFFVTALLFDKLKSMLNFLKQNSKKISIVSGTILIFIGVLMILGKY